MEQFLKNDYIEHWENGVGKVTNVDDETIAVDFKLYGNIVQPIERSESFKKLDSKGLLAQLYENENYTLFSIDVDLQIENPTGSTFNLTFICSPIPCSQLPFMEDGNEGRAIRTVRSTIIGIIGTEDIPLPYSRRTFKIQISYCTDDKGEGWD